MIRLPVTTVVTVLMLFTLGLICPAQDTVTPEIPEVGGPEVNPGGTATITPGGTVEGTETTSPATENQTVTEQETPTDSTMPDSTVRPGEDSPPVITEPGTTDDRQVPTIVINEPSTPTTPAGTGAGPGTTTSSQSSFANDPYMGSADYYMGGDGSRNEVLPAAGVELGWFAVAGSILIGLGAAVRKRAR